MGGTESVEIREDPGGTSVTTRLLRLKAARAQGEMNEEEYERGRYILCMRDVRFTGSFFGEGDTFLPASLRKSSTCFLVLPMLLSVHPDAPLRTSTPECVPPLAYTKSRLRSLPPVGG